MLISERYKFIYIGIPKTGTRSAREALCALEGRNLEDNKLYLPPGHKESINHATARQTRELNKEIWDLYFKFAVVRNPWERTLSWYAGLASEKKGAAFDSWLFDYFRSPAGGLVNARRRYDLDAFPKKIAREELVDYWRDFLLPCAEWVTDESGHVIVDYIARFETLTQDWEVICERIGITAPLPHANQSRHLHYSAYYTDEMAAFLASRYGKDIEMFGYRFERMLDPSMASS